MSAAAPAPETTIHNPPDREELEAEGLKEDIGFGKAILLGSAAGIVIFGVICYIAVKLIAGSDIGWGADLAISFWVGVWGGLFLGGTITVGLWSRHHGH